jgi:hypothetical protein
MSTKTPTLAERAAKLTGKQALSVSATVPVESQNQKVQRIKKDGNVDKRFFNRGHEGLAGRKPLEALRQENRQNYQQFIQEPITAQVTGPDGKQRAVKLTRLQVGWHKMFGKVMQGDMRAIEEVNERAMGKESQIIAGDETAPIRLVVDF